MELESPYPGKAHQPQEQRYPFLPVTGVCRCVQTMVYGCQCLGFLTCAQMLIDAIALGGCPDTGGEFALKLTLGENSFQHRGLQPPYILGIEWWNVWRFRGKRLSHCVRQNEVCSFSAVCNLCHTQRVKGLANFGVILLVCYKCIIITAKTQRLLLRWCVAYLFALLSFLYSSIHSIFTCIISLF